MSFPDGMSRFFGCTLLLCFIVSLLLSLFLLLFSLISFKQSKIHLDTEGTYSTEGFGILCPCPLPTYRIVGSLFHTSALRICLGSDCMDLSPRCCSVSWVSSIMHVCLTFLNCKRKIIIGPTPKVVYRMM